MTKTNVKTFLGLGSNLGDRRGNIIIALQEIQNVLGEVVSISHLYETEPWGNDKLKPFYNMACEVETHFSPLEILNSCKEIERKAGRKTPKGSYTDRIIDIDLLFMENFIFHHQKLKIPHPEVPNRRFVLIPLTDIKPDFIHPVFQKSIQTLLDETEDHSLVKKVENSDQLLKPNP